MSQINSPSELAAIITIAALLFAALFFVIDARIRRILAELKPNHGSSVRDAVDRIEHKIDRHYEWHMENK